MLATSRSYSLDRGSSARYRIHLPPYGIHRTLLDPSSTLQDPSSTLQESVQHLLMSLKQQRFDPVRVNGVFAWRPREDREAAVLRGDEGEPAVLVVDELRR